MIHRELWKKKKKKKFKHPNEWNIPKFELVLEKETHKVLLDFEVQMDHLTSARRSDLLITLVYKEIEASTKIPFFT